MVTSKNLKDEWMELYQELGFFSFLTNSGKLAIKASPSGEPVSPRTCSKAILFKSIRTESSKKGRTSRIWSIFCTNFEKLFANV